MSEAKPQVVIIAGPNGAGKTTLAPFLLRDTFGLLEFVNADMISAGLSAFNAEAVALDAGRVMLTRLRELAAHKQSFAFEIPLADTWVVYDNSATGSPSLIASGEKQRTPIVVRPDLWQTLSENKQ